MLESLTVFQQRNNQQLAFWLDHLPTTARPLVEPMGYSLLQGGKRIRPYLVYLTGQMLGAKIADLDTPASAIECIHVYSLIHDDLPAMDDDNLRRGHPTCHIQFNEATAILAGDALQSLAFQIIAQGNLSPIAEPLRIAMVQTLAQASGATGMCLGQTLDLAAENHPITLAELEHIHRHKTGALIRAAVHLGALAAGQNQPEVLNALDQYASAIGLAFQVQDDILDITEDTTTLGKPQGSDLTSHKSTYPALLGLEGAKTKALELQHQALNALKDLSYHTEPLAQFARYVIERNN